MLKQLIRARNKDEESGERCGRGVPPVVASGVELALRGE